MKKYSGLFPLSLSCLALLVVLQGCLKDTHRETYRIYVPIFKTLTEVRAGMKSGAARPLKNTGKLNLFGNYIFLNEVNEGIHVIDNTNPAAPRNVAFIPIPNNIDLAVRGNYLYADTYSDIAVFDISQPANVRPVKFVNNVIKDKNRYWYSTQTNADSIRVVVGYETRDTTVDVRQYRGWNNCANCMTASADLKGYFYSSAPQVGLTGSMSRFSIVNDYLYAVSNSELYSLSLADPASPQQTSTRNLGWNIETIYPFENKLFIGSRTGMFIYNLANPASPAQVSQFFHLTSCDPVISDGKYAYVTLRSGTTCNGIINQLEVIDIANLSSPVLKATVPMASPHGLSKDGNTLFVCDGTEGLKMYNATTPTAPQLVKQLKGLETFDVIATDGRAIVVAKDGLYQYTYNGSNLAQVSKLPIESKN